MKNEDRVRDWRSTGRRKARRALYASYRDYACEGYTNKQGRKIECRKTTIEPPKDAPAWFEEIWPEENRVLTSQLQADHLTKDLTINTDEFLEWACPSCHKLKDQQTAKGEATISEDYW
jgi:hypothetical protein